MTYQAKALGIISLMVLALIYNASLGVSAGWYTWLPGSMSRHRDAEAVAITAVAYKTWQGYASFRSVNQALIEGGLTVQPQHVEGLGATRYVDVMKDTARLEAALKAASSLEAPAAGGMYYSQDEKGMAAFFIAAFALFGISATSWYWLYVCIYSLSVLVACAVFRRRIAVLFFILTLVSAHAIVASMLPSVPPQDVNVIQGNRFLGIMASVAMFHLMWLMILRIPPNAGTISSAIFQALVICLTVNARTSALWIVVAHLCCCGWYFGVLG
jgi:hypothetical protein